MKTIALDLDDETLELAQRLAREKGGTLEDLLKALIGKLGDEARERDPLLGLLFSEPEVADRVAEAALSARERLRLREPGGGQNTP